MLPSKSTTHYQYLRSIPPQKGILIETTRFLLNNNYSAGCDHLRMAINSKYLDSTNNNILTLHMNDFKHNNIEPTLKVLFSFLFGDEMSKKYLKIVLCQYKKNYEQAKNKNHVTHNKYSENHKKKLLDLLRNNKEISLILDYINLKTPNSYFVK